MANGIFAWDADNASDNDDIDPIINWIEGQAASTVNNSARAMMRRVAQLLVDTSGTLKAGGSGNHYTIATKTSFTSYQEPMIAAFEADKTNTGASDLAVDGLTAKPIVNANGAALSEGQIVDGGVYLAVYNAALDSMVALNIGEPFPALQPPRTTHGDSNTTLTEDDRDLVVSAPITAARTWTLLPADTFDAGTVVRVSDPSGLVTTTYPISIAADGSETINGGTAALIVGPRFELELITDGVSNWQAILEGPTNMTWLASGSTAAASSQDIPLQPFIARGYRKFFLKLRNVRPATDDTELRLRLSTDNAATFLTSGHQWGITASSIGDNTVYADGDYSDAYIYLGLSLSNGSSERSRFGLVIECAPDNFDLLGSGSVFTSVDGIANYTNTGYIEQIINGLQLSMGSGNITAMNWSLYGVS